MNEQIKLDEEYLLEGPVEQPKDLADLGWIARRIAANQKQADLVSDFRDREVEKIIACCNAKIEQITANSNYLQGMAEGFLRTSGYCYDKKDQRKYDMPGIGAFKFALTRESVKSTDYDSAPEDAQKQIQIDWPDYFRTTVKVSPDKKIIGEALKAGGQVEGFKLTNQTETFSFKGDNNG